MGESKWRKQHDVNYGKAYASPTQSKSFERTTFLDDPNDRGLVISNPIEFQPKGMYMRSSDLDPQELRFSLLYWDKLVWPQNRHIQLASGRDALYLEDAKILTRPESVLDLSRGEISEVILNGQVSIFKELETLQPSQWALAQGEGSLVFTNGFKPFGTVDGALIGLHRAIPIPSHEVPLAEILEFKNRRKDELIALRSQFEKMTSEIMASQAPEDALQKNLSEIDRICADLLEVGREWQWPVKLGSWNASITVEPAKMASLAFAASGAASKAYSIGLPGCIAIAAGTALLSTLSFKPSTVNLQGVKRPMHPYRYAHSIDSELY